MNLREVGTIYWKELRTALRERTIVVNSILMPIFLYPALLWVMFTGFTFVEGLAEGFTSRVAVFGAPAEHGELLDSLAALESVEVAEGAGAPATPEEARAAITEGELDAVVEFLSPEAAGAPLANNFRVRVSYDRAVERSRRAYDRVEALVDRHRERWMELQAARFGVTPEERAQFTLTRRDVSTRSARGATILAQLIPFFLVVMVALGCFVPSVDTTAGERERSTWETTMTLAASRRSLIVAKYLNVATLGVLAGVLNVLAVMVSIGAVIAPLAAQEGRAAAELSFRIPFAAYPVLIVGAVVLALFFAAAMMLLASFARTFKDGQVMVTPVYWLIFIPMFMGSQAEVQLTAVRAAIPILNLAQMMKDAILGVFHWPWIAESLAVTAVSVVLLLAVARWVLSFEDFLLGAHDGSFWTFLKERRGVATRRAAAEST